MFFCGSLENYIASAGDSGIAIVVLWHPGGNGLLFMLQTRSIDLIDEEKLRANPLPLPVPCNVNLACSRVVS
jgi:hypothetical protein